MSTTKNAEIEFTAKELAKILEVTDSLDFGKVIELTSRLAKLDPHHVRFTSDAALIYRLGHELVARQETALSELAKNAYDADATRLKVEFIDSDPLAGSLILEDDGNGMTRDELITGFMRLASPAKIENPTSPVFGRGRAGRKGIGRFATQRLGGLLELTTQTRESELAHRVTIDWSLFVPGVDLAQIAPRIETLPKARPFGTTLRIVGLKDRWTDAQVSRVFRYIEELIDPFPGFNTPVPLQAPRGPSDDPGFKAVFSRRRVTGVSEVIASEERLLLEHAVARVDATIDASGNASYHIESSRLALKESGPLNADEQGSRTSLVFNHLSNVYLRAFYFIYDSDLLPGHLRGRVQRLAREQGGFRLYRNGFRVLPYGERFNDWLGLDEESRRRVILPALANTNWFGVIRVDDPDHAMFTEVSSREGLEKNDALDELTAFGRAVAIRTAVRVAGARGKKKTAGEGRPAAPTSPEVTPVRLRELADLLTRDDAVAAAPLNTLSAVPNTSSLAASGLRAAAQVLQERDEEIEILRVLASLGLLIAIFTHEARTRVMSIRDQLTALRSAEKLAPDLKVMAEKASEATTDLRAYLGYFDDALVDVHDRKLEPQDVSGVIYEFARTFEPIAVKLGIEVIPDVEEGLVSTPMHAAEWSSLLTNLFTNSVKAIRRMGAAKGKIKIEAKRNSGNLVIRFEDDGDGIPPENRELIFDAFFTTSSSSNFDELAGMGLGLKIARDIVVTRQGRIFAAESSAEYSTCICIEMPAV